MVMGLRWSDRVAAGKRPGQSAPRSAFMSRTPDEMPPKSSGLRHLGGTTLDLGTGAVRGRDGFLSTLRPQSVEVLRAVAARRGKVVSKDDLFQEVWPGITVTDNSLVQCVSDIRRVLREDGHRLLQTVPKRGYRLALDNDTGPALCPDLRSWSLLGAMVLA